MTAALRIKQHLQLTSSGCSAQMAHVQPMCSSSNPCHVCPVLAETRVNSYAQAPLCVLSYCTWHLLYALACSAQVAELSYWKQQAVSRYDGLERDNQGLRRRVAELLRLGEKRSKSGEALSLGVLAGCSWARDGNRQGASSKTAAAQQQQHHWHTKEAGHTAQVPRSAVLQYLFTFPYPSWLCFSRCHCLVPVGNFEPIDEAFKIALSKPLSERRLTAMVAQAAADRGGALLRCKAAFAPSHKCANASCALQLLCSVTGSTSEHVNSAAVCKMGLTACSINVPVLEQHVFALPAAALPMLQAVQVLPHSPCLLP
jgi:hypothetical protein